MLVTLVVVMMIIGAAVVGSIYSGFLVFYSNFSETDNYHRAYYTSISALERGELVTKQQDPGYIGSGGFKNGIGTGSVGNITGGSDGSLSNFSYLWQNSGSSTIFWDVNSRKTGRIPSTGDGNVEDMLSTGDAKNYNIMDYENAEVFLLYYDDYKGIPYAKISCWNGDERKGSHCKLSKPNEIKGIIRLPKLLLEKGFGNLDTKGTLNSFYQNNIPGDESIVDWQIRGVYEDDGYYPFTVFSTRLLDNNKKVNYLLDTVFRESHVNSGLNFSFHNSKDPIEDDYKFQGNKLTVIGTKQSEIEEKDFENILGGLNVNIVSKNIRFSLLNLVKSEREKIYPYLEYYIDFGGKSVSDKYYTIIGEGNFGDYQVKTIVKKPTVKESILGNFTTVF